MKFTHQTSYPLGELLSFQAYALRYNAISSRLGNEVYELGPNHLRHWDMGIRQDELHFMQKSVLELAECLDSLLLGGLFNAMMLADAAKCEDFVRQEKGLTS